MNLPSLQQPRSKSRPYSERGNILLMTLVIVGLVGIVLVVFISMVSNQNSLTMRSLAFAKEIPIAEAGIEEAMSHLNSATTTNRAADGWTLTNNAYVKQRTLGDGYFYACISTDNAPVITCTGYARIFPQNIYSQRALRVVATNAPWQYAILAKDLIKMSGGSIIDSFNSSSSTYSSNGFYSSTKAKDQAKVGTLGTTTKIIDAGTGKIYGQVATGPSGTVGVDSSGAIGDAAYVNSGTHGGTVQSGHSRDDMNAYIANVGVPFTNGFFTPFAGAVGGTNYTYVISSGDWKLSTINLSGGNAAIVTGNARLYVTGDITVSGSGYILLTSSGSLMLYIGGKCTVSGMGVVNGSNKAANFSIWGLPTCTQAEYSGSAAYIGTIYVPQAALKLSGSAGMSGAVVANSVDMSGGASVHFDEALSASTGAAYAIISWTEL